MVTPNLCCFLGIEIDEHVDRFHHACCNTDTMPSNKKKRSNKKKQPKQTFPSGDKHGRAPGAIFFAVSKAIAHQSTVRHDLEVADPPPYADLIDDILMATKLTEGFRNLGKLRGALGRVWQASRRAITDAILGGHYTMVHEQPPLFALLSPHHRIRLLRQVAVGLLCEDTPLPPDTLWYYVAFLAPLQYAIDGCIDIELNEENMTTYNQ